MTTTRPARLAAAALALLAAHPSFAEEERSWSVQVTPYVWGSGVSGSLAPVPGGPSLDFDASLSEVLEDLDGAFFLSAYARYGRWVLLGDISASASSREGVVPPGVPAEGELSQRSVTLLAGWRAPSDPRIAFDVLAGLRSWDVELSAAVPPLGLAASREVSFTDPIVALRANFALTPRLSAIVYADLGGFGHGSEWTDQVVATLNYAVTERFYLSGGWRRLHVEYEEDGTAFDATLSGPILGATWRF